MIGRPTPPTCEDCCDFLNHKLADMTFDPKRVFDAVLLHYTPV